MAPLKSQADEFPPKSDKDEFSAMGAINCGGFHLHIFLYTDEAEILTRIEYYLPDGTLAIVAVSPKHSWVLRAPGIVDEKLDGPDFGDVENACRAVIDFLDKRIGA